MKKVTHGQPIDELEENGQIFFHNLPCLSAASGAPILCQDKVIGILEGYLRGVDENAGLRGFTKYDN